MFGDAVETAIRIHAMHEYPREACGVVTAGGYEPLENVAVDPEESFDCTEQLQAYLEAGTALALVHSHPDGPRAPSAGDMRRQISMDIPWGIVTCTHDSADPAFYWSDSLAPPPLIGRGFRWGPSGTDGCGDCAALVRDYYWMERSIRLPEFAREDGYWRVPGVSYRDNLITSGFQSTDRTQPEIGDVFLAAVRSEQPNHAGIYVGEGKILHHLQERLSVETPVVIWLRFMTDWMRYRA